tara:strand:+ start:202 stop:351 length:150 start_codon:yes stop_codon:yes gene_type:complete
MSTLSLLRGEKPEEEVEVGHKSTMTLQREAAAAAAAKAAAKKTTSKKTK